MSQRHVISRLLAGRNRLSRSEKEEILEAVLAEVAPERRRRWWFVAAPAVAAVAVVLLVIAAPWRSGSTGELTPRGGANVAAAFTPRCTQGCGSGAKILFDLHGTVGFPYFAAFSRRADGTVLWYFPAEAGTSVDVVHQTTKGVLDRGIVIGSEHPPGSYRVYGVFSREPLTRQQIRDRFDEAALTAGPGTAVVVQELVVR